MHDETSAKCALSTLQERTLLCSVPVRSLTCYESLVSEAKISDKREGARMTINKEFESFDAFINEYVTNISESGVFVRTANPLSIGTSVNLCFTVILNDIETIEGVGEVVRVEQDPPGMGVVFTELSQYSQHLITRLLTKRSSKKA